MNQFKKLAPVVAVIVIVGLIVSTFLNDGWKRYLDIGLCSVYSVMHLEQQYHPHTGGLGACP